MYQISILFTFLFIHQINCFMHDFIRQDSTEQNNAFISNLFTNPYVIEASLIDVSRNDEDSSTDQSSIELIKQLNLMPEAMNNSSLDDLRDRLRNAILKQTNQTNKTKRIYKREISKFAENDDQFDFEFEEEIDRIKSEFDPFFVTRSSASSDAPNKSLIREYIISKFNNLKMKTYKQPFQITVQHTNSIKKGVNLFSYYPSRKRRQALKDQSKLLNDQILVIGAHYDTVQSPGIDDNASGVVMLLELARMLSINKVNLNYTIIFVCFDFEELGLHGSKAFVDKFIIPIELIERQSQWLGAYITDMLLNYNNEPNSQTLPSDIRAKVPNVSAISDENQNRGNYIAMWNRRNIDKELATRLMDVWNKSPDSSRFKLFGMNPRLPNTIKPPYTPNDLGTFIRSDHANFWYPKAKNFDKTLHAVLLTDLGPWRSPSKACYHKICDNAEQLTKKNLEFYLHTNKMLYLMLTQNPPTLNVENRNRPNSNRRLSNNRIPRIA